MNKLLTIGKRIIPAQQIVLVEPFDPARNPEFKAPRDYKARIVLMNYDTLLSEDAPESFVETLGFRLLPDDQMAVNPSIVFRVEVFTATDDFNPERPFSTRLKWRDADHIDHSKLLLTPPEAVTAVVFGDDKYAPSRRPALVREMRRARKPAPAR